MHRPVPSLPEKADCTYPRDARKGGRSRQPAGRYRDGHAHRHFAECGTARDRPVSQAQRRLRFSHAENAAHFVHGGSPARHAADRLVVRRHSLWRRADLCGRDDNRHTGGVHDISVAPLLADTGANGAGFGAGIGPRLARPDLHTVRYPAGRDRVRGRQALRRIARRPSLRASYFPP